MAIRRLALSHSMYRHPKFARLCGLAAVAFVVGCTQSSNDSNSETGQRTTPAINVSESHQSKAAISPGKIESTPFAQRKSSGGEHLFETLDPKAIGIDFYHAWTKRPGQLRNNTTGCGVAMGDYDGDGFVDVFLPRSTDGGRLYRNLGDFKFEDVSERAGILSPPERWTTGATFVDVDNDGDLDLYVCGFDCPNHLYINQGDGTFVERGKQYGLDYRGSSAMAAFSDYDRDGDLDVYLLTNHIPPPEEIEYSLKYDRSGVPRVPEEYLQYHDALPLPDGSYGVIESGQYDHLYRNNGDGTFTDVSTDAGISGNHKGLGIVWWDYNNDSWPDAYVANDFYGPDRLYHNNRDGTFTDVAEKVLPHTPWFSMGCDQGDLNNDGLFDLVGTDMSADTHRRANTTMGDVQDEGWFLDLPTPRQYMRNAVYLGTGCQRVLEAAHLTGLDSTNWTWSVRFVDLDQDGRADLHVTNGMSRDWGNSDLKQSAMKLGPLNSEIYNDFWDRQAPLRERNFAFRNLGDLRLENVSQEWGLDHLGVSFGVAFGDLDGDGDLDLVINNFDEMVTVARNDGTSGNAVRIRLVGTRSNRWGLDATVHIRTGDQRQAGYLTLSRGFMSASDPTLHFGLGDAGTIDELTVNWPSGETQTFTDLSANHLYTITEPSTAATPSTAASPQTKPQFVPTDALHLLRHVEAAFDDFAREPLLSMRLSKQGPGIACGDVDGDGRDDLFLGGAKGAWGVMLYHRGKEKWAAPDELFPPWSSDEEDCENTGVLLFDCDADDDLDLLIASGGVECEPRDPSLRDQLYLNDGSGTFERAPKNRLPDVRDSGSIAAAADFDRDGDLDVFIGSRSIPGQFPRTPPSRLLQNNAGTFRDVTESLAPELLTSGLITGGLWTDVDGDGWIDLVVTHDWGPIKLYRNDRGRLRDATADAGLADRLGWWNAIAGRDLDGDGDLDYIATNRGRNTAFRPTPEHPARAFYGDFNADGNNVYVEGKYDERGRLVPNRSKPEIELALPYVEAAYPTFKEYAEATLPEILGEQELDDALQLEVNFTDSVLLRNDGDGRFTVESLPLAVQMAPAFGVALDDFNGDGFSDCYVVQNSYAPRREIGNLDGGISVLLNGANDGSLHPVAPTESGLVVPGDAKSAVVTHLNDDRWPDLVVGVNSARVMAFENTPSENNRLATVALQGAAGNPTAVGARVTLLRSDGVSQTAEAQAGGGYLSQQTATLHFGLGPTATIREIEVRWPNGTTTKHTPPAGELDLQLRQPEEKTRQSHSTPSPRLRRG